MTFLNYYMMLDMHFLKEMVLILTISFKSKTIFIKIKILIVILLQYINNLVYCEA